MKTKRTVDEAMELVQGFYDHWYDGYSGWVYPNIKISDKKILEYIDSYGSIENAADKLADYLLSQGLADVVE